jgi:tetraacyldisaccharide 4'-kinase
VSIGNISMGGRGKTPIVRLVARLLAAAGERPAILSRGYGRRINADGVVVVSDGTHVVADLDRSGDEPLMLARSVPGATVLVCDQRAIAAALAERVFGATVHVLDDGFQHRSLRRDLDIVAIAPEDLRDRRAPFGRLRQSPSTLRAANAIVIDGRREDADLRHLTCPTFVMTRALGDPVPIDPGKPAPRPGATVVAVAGIARPERFADSLKAAGWTVASLLSFPDHHRYSPVDLDRIASALHDTGAAGVLTTEKDAVRLRSLRPLPVALAAVPLTIALDAGGGPEFEPWLLGRLREIRS